MTDLGRKAIPKKAHERWTHLRKFLKRKWWKRAREEGKKLIRKEPTP